MEIIPIVWVCVLLTVLIGLMVNFNHKRNERSAAINHTLPMVVSCDSCDKMLDVYNTLSQNTKKHNIKINYNFRGYFS